MTVELLPLDVIHKAHTRGVAGITPVLHASDQLVVGKKTQRHQAAGNTLPMDQWVSACQMEPVYASWFWMRLLLLWHWDWAR